jgi:hypothetical protein
MLPTLSDLLACWGGLGVGSHSVLHACTVSFYICELHVSDIQALVATASMQTVLHTACCAAHSASINLNTSTGKTEHHMHHPPMLAWSLHQV